MALTGLKAEILKCDLNNQFEKAAVKIAVDQSCLQFVDDKITGRIEHEASDYVIIRLETGVPVMIAFSSWKDKNNWTKLRTLQYGHNYDKNSFDF